MCGLHTKMTPFYIRSWASLNFGIEGLTEPIPCRYLGPTVTEAYYITVWEARSPKSSCQQGWFLLKVIRENVPCFFPSFWWFVGNLWHSLECRCITPVFHLHMAFFVSLHIVFPLCMSVSRFSLFYKDTSYIGLGPTLMTSSYLEHLSAKTISK